MASDESKFPINQEISERRQRSKSFIDKCFDSLPFECHFYKYRFAGPGTKLKERLARGELGVNKFDDFCRQHDLCYNDENADRREADKILVQQAFSRIVASDSPPNERVVATFAALCLVLKIWSDTFFSLLKRKSTSFVSLFIKRRK